MGFIRAGLDAWFRLVSSRKQVRSWKTIHFQMFSDALVAFLRPVDRMGKGFRGAGMDEDWNSWLAPLLPGDHRRSR
jgi:hypothetical protein